MSFFDNIDIDANFLNDNYVGLYEGQTNDTHALA